MLKGKKTKAPQKNHIRGYPGDAEESMMNDRMVGYHYKDRSISIF